MSIIRETAEMSDTERMVARNSNMQYFLNEFWDKIYPIGSIYISAASTSPATLFGGTWERIKDTFLLASGDTYTAGATGGEAKHTLTVDEMPSHSHNADVYYDGTGVRNYDYVDTGHNGGTLISDRLIKKSGGGQPHNNMPPYLAVYVWQRTA